MTRETLRDHLQRLIERDLELVCRRAHTTEKYAGAPMIRVFADGREFLILVGERPTLGVPNPYQADALAPLPQEVQRGRECTQAELAELDRTEDW